MKRFTLLLLAAALVACTGTPEPTQRYLLSEPALEPVQHTRDQSHLYAVGRVQLSEYLSGSGLVYKLDENRVHETQQHRWAEPLSGQLRRQLRQGMQQQLPATRWLPFSGPSGQATDYQLDLQLDAFYINADGDVRVAGSWQLRDHAQALISDGGFDQQLALAEDGYPAAVNALSRAWHNSLVAIAEDLADQSIRSKEDTN